MPKKLNYKKSGVNIQKAEKLVRWIKKTNPSPHAFSASDYAALWPFPTAEFQKPVLVATTDGVGTKLKIAHHFKTWEGIGQDLVAMCVNDLICVGAKPLFFMDYYACGQLKPLQAKAFLKGLKKACHEATCPLSGGEIAEMAGFYPAGEVDCAGFCVGVVEKSKILKPHRVRPGDDIVAFKSSGFHSNGYSLLRKIYNSPSQLKKHKKNLIRPTKLYAFLSDHFHQIRGLRAIAHITGGGLDNLSRILPKGLVADLKPWLIPSCFLDVKQKANLSWRALLQTFNCGLGLVLIVQNKKSLFSLFPEEELIDLGKVVHSSLWSPAQKRRGLLWSQVKNGGSKSWRLNFRKL